MVGGGWCGDGKEAREGVACHFLVEPAGGAKVCFFLPFFFFFHVVVAVNPLQYTCLENSMAWRALCRFCTPYSP